MTKRFSASSAAQLIQCPGSANLELAIPGYVEPKRDEMAGAKGVGTRMHDSFRPLATWDMTALDDLRLFMYHYSKLHWKKRRALLEDWTTTESEEILFMMVPSWSQHQINTIMDWVSELDAEEKLPPQMLVYVQQTIEELYNLRATYGPEFYQTFAEKSIECSWLKSNPMTTPDIVFVLPQHKRLIIIDYKTGKIPVSPVANDQLMFYAVSALHAYSIGTDQWSDDLTIEMIIWQPGHHESWETDLQTLTLWKKQAHAADLRIERKDLTLRPGSSCTFCPANPHSRGDKAPPYCPAQMGLLYPDKTDEEAVLDL